MKHKHLALAVAALALSVPAIGQPPSAQQQKPGAQPAQARAQSVARFYTVTPKEGHAKQLEKGIKAHMEFHRRSGDKGPWHVWSVATGPMMGSYLVGTLGRTWEGLAQTELGPEDEADVEANIAPHVARVSGSIWVFRGDISPAAESSKPANFAQVEEFVLSAEGVPAFEETVKQITQAMMKVPEQQRAGPPPMLYELVAGGESPTVALVFNRDTWGDFAPRGTNPMQALEQSLGQEKARQIMQSGGQAIRRIETQILRYRPDLSSPGGM